MITPVGLPRRGLCRVCEAEQPVRVDGTVAVHDGPPDGPIHVVRTAQGWASHQRCPGSRRPPAVVLEPTFARWLHAHAARRDAASNPATFLGQAMFRGCTRGPYRMPGDVEWRTAGELHAHLHGRQAARTGSPLTRRYCGEMCDWMCEYVDQAAAVYEQLCAAAG